MTGEHAVACCNIDLRVNGRAVSLCVPPYLTLKDLLRDELHLYSVKCGCEDSNCGACTVLFDGMAIKSCCLLAVQAEGHSIVTVDGLTREGKLHPVQQAFIDHFAIQCGFCTPGMILSAVALLDANPHPTEDEIREALHGNICRCTGYKKIVEAVQAVGNGEYGPYVPLDWRA